MIRCRKGLLRSAHRSPVFAQLTERVKRTVMAKVPIDIDQRLPAFSLGNDMPIPNFFEKSFAGHGRALPDFIETSQK